MIHKGRAIEALCPGVSFSYNEEKSGIINWYSEEPQPTEEEIEAKQAELINAEPMRLLRLERNRRLAQSDWRASSDLTLSSEWSSYRQALRDLPSTGSPTLDSYGNLQGVTWPDEPT
jgi:hypothetical protein